MQWPWTPAEFSQHFFDTLPTSALPSRIVLRELQQGVQQFAQCHGRLIRDEEILVVRVEKMAK